MNWLTSSTLVLRTPPSIRNFLRPGHLFRSLKFVFLVGKGWYITSTYPTKPILTLTSLTWFQHLDIPDQTSFCLRMAAARFRLRRSGGCPPSPPTKLFCTCTKCSNTSRRWLTPGERLQDSRMKTLFMLPVPATMAPMPFLKQPQWTCNHYHGHVVWRQCNHLHQNSVDAIQQVNSANQLT